MSEHEVESAAAGLQRQHLIDPEICIRCNTCEEMCPRDAITHDGRNYVVSFDICNACGDCLSPCPTGAIDNWRQVIKPWSVDDQYGFDALPDDASPEALASSGGSDGVSTQAGGSVGALPSDVKALTDEATKGMGGASVPPWSAAHPYTNLYKLDRPLLATCAGNFRITGEHSGSDIHHIVLDFGKAAFPVLEGQSIGILPPGTDAHGRPHHVRLYSVASPRNGERTGYNNLALTVKRVTEDAVGQPVSGVASSFLCELKKGDPVAVVGPYGTTFLMPNHPGSNLIMICTGTGSAPMRAMTERRRRRMGLGEGGQLMLFFGARTPEELPYFGPLMKLPKELIDVELAFSRIPDAPREYVQDRMLQRSDRLAELLKSEDTYVYLCGHKRMEVGVHDALTQICARHGLPAWPELLETLRQGGRFHVETYY